MERTGGEPDVVGRRRGHRRGGVRGLRAREPAWAPSLCYDGGARGAAGEQAARERGRAWRRHGAELRTEAQYRALQALGPFDLKTSSWIRTPEPIRALAGPLFCDRRYDTVFVYHNGADSYYASRGFRARLCV
jgi:hypothetical protein